MPDAADRRKMQSIPPDHDALGAPNLRDQQGPPVGMSDFQQIKPKTTQADLTKSTPGRKSGDIKFGRNLP